MENSNPYDLAGQEKARADAEAKARIARDIEEGDFKWLMSSKRGRRIVWRILDQAGVFRSTFSPTAMQMAFNEGNRNFGNRMLALVHEYCPELYPQMMKENTNARRDDSANRDNQ